LTFKKKVNRSYCRHVTVMSCRHDGIVTALFNMPSFSNSKQKSKPLSDATKYILDVDDSNDEHNDENKFQEECSTLSTGSPHFPNWQELDDIV
jgi:hypothetical protein